MPELLDALLERTSRTFALSIPLLPEPTRREVTVAYLLFRVADTLEDASGWPRERRVEALGRLPELLARPDPDVAVALARQWSAEVPCANAGYRDLLAELPAVLDAFFALDRRAAALIAEHMARTTRGMAGFVARASADGELALVDLGDLGRYCYVVAGIVGELLTELFLLDREALAPAAPALRRLSPPFGEGLQLVNILKDAAADATEGRRYLPDGIARSEVLALARRDLDAARAYVLELQRARAESGLVAFTALPVRLADATLDRVEALGPGSKLTRQEVFTIAAEVALALERGEPVVPEPAVVGPGTGVGPRTMHHRPEVIR